MPSIRRAPFLIVFSLLAACGGKEKGGPPKQPPVPVGIMTVAPKIVPLEVRVVGNVEAFAAVQIRAQVSGEITRIQFREGDFVSKGAALFQIDPRPFHVALQQAEAALARAQAEAANARTEAARNEEMLGNNLISKEAAERSRAIAATAGAALKAAQAGVASAQLQISYANIRSPIAGRTGRLLIQKGDIVRAGDAVLVTVNQISPLFVTFNVPERFLEAIQSAMRKRPLDVYAESATGQVKAAGKLTFIDNAVNPSTGTIFMKAQFQNTRGELWPGQFSNVVIVLGRQENIITVPGSAVATGQQGDYVYIVDADETAQIRPVTVDRTVGEEAVISRGLAAGDRVIIDGQTRLVPKAKVEVKNIAGSEAAP